MRRRNNPRTLRSQALHTTIPAIDKFICINREFPIRGQRREGLLIAAGPTVPEPNEILLVVRGDRFAGMDGVFKQRAERVCA